jgi:hypothetical protein
MFNIRLNNNTSAVVTYDIVETVQTCVSRGTFSSKIFHDVRLIHEQKDIDKEKLK